MNGIADEPEAWRGKEAYGRNLNKLISNTKIGYYFPNKAPLTWVSITTP